MCFPKGSKALTTAFHLVHLERLEDAGESRVPVLLCREQCQHCVEASCWTDQFHVFQCASEMEEAQYSHRSGVSTRLVCKFCGNVETASGIDRMVVFTMTQGPHTQHFQCFRLILPMGQCRWKWKWILMEVPQSQSGAHTKKKQLPNNFVARTSECS